MSSMSYAQGTSSAPLLGMTIGEILVQTVQTRRDAEALVVHHQGVRWSYAELGERADRLARALVAYGLKPGDRMGIWAPNCAEWVLVQFASATAGVVLVNINPAYRAAELEYVLRQSGLRLLVAASALRDVDCRAMVGEIAPHCEALERTVFLGDASWEELMALGNAVTELPHRLQFDDPINIQYTSGTTGFPKGATLSHHNIVNNAYFVGRGCNYSPEDRVCIPVPFYHCFGMVMGTLSCVVHGACIVVPAPSFDPQATLETVERERCTSLYGVPTMFIAELEHPGFESYELISLRTGIMAGSPCPVEVMRKVIERMHMRDVTICYGMTETSPVSTQSSAGDDVEHRTATAGRVHPHLEIKVIDPATGAVVPRGEPGELCTRGYSVMLGYWGERQATDEAIDRANWMHTGDLATMDDDGYVKIVGRAKDVVIRGGENVYPREIEEFLYTHPGIADVQVVGVPDHHYGEQIAACVICREGSAIDAMAVQEFCEGRIAHYKIPRYVLVVTEFPMTVTGKIQKFKLREQAIAELGLEGERVQTAQ